MIYIQTVNIDGGVALILITGALMLIYLLRR